jgi:hypothetical protein
MRSRALLGSVAPPTTYFAQYEAVSGRRLEREAIDLACLGSLAQMGFRFALGAFASGPEPPDIAAAQLEWWTRRAHLALDRIGSL